jgi:hypothetical protein
MKPRLRRQLAVLAAVSIAVLGLGTAPAGADPTNPRAVPDHCTLMPSGHYGVGEWSSCLRASATLSAAPSIGQRATLRFEVQAQVARPDVEISVELPAALRFDRAPAGLR